MLDARAQHALRQKIVGMFLEEGFNLAPDAWELLLTTENLSKTAEVILLEIKKLPERPVFVTQKIVESIISEKPKKRTFGVKRVTGRGSLGSMERETSLFDYVPSEVREKFFEKLVGKKAIIETRGIPEKVPNGAILSIMNTDVTYLTHGLHGFPAKFIPQIPRWTLEKFSKRKEVVLDPFCGSGTTLVEAKLLRRNSYGVDIDPLAQLLTKVKTTPLDIKKLKDTENWLLDAIRSDNEIDYQLPNLPRIDHWFKGYVQRDLGVIKKHILEIEDRDIRDFFIVCFSSIVKNASNADPQFLFSVQYSKKMRELDKKGRVIDVFKLFEDTLNVQVPKMIEFSKQCPVDVFAKTIEIDARQIDVADESIDLATTSPPYINAMDYIRSHRLEMYWIDLLQDQGQKIALQKKFIGTERVYAKDYNDLKLFGHEQLDQILEEIYKKDKRRSYITYKFFVDMKRNFEEVWRVIKRGSRYVMVIGDGVIRQVPVPTHKILADIGKSVGFEIENFFSYILKNRYMRIDRKGEGGLIEYDWITVFRKE